MRFKAEGDILQVTFTELPFTIYLWVDMVSVSFNVAGTQGFGGNS